MICASAGTANAASANMASTSGRTKRQTPAGASARIAPNPIMPPHALTQSLPFLTVQAPSRATKHPIFWS
ncbi:hypothetical protein GCM10007913_05700 [Devosia yakushimensis]|uniref:Uncharacterized protein n=1 Tax=Devosia yakushimensis TaxID=470028 RepID=A0ABQ5UAI0_9HYPH|nr:hypothetical protein GCM10007913_05700 [Devosia yakushimensis]